MTPARLPLFGALFAVAACGPSPEEFGEKCQSIAGIEVKDASLWRDYLRERKELLLRGKVTVNGKEIDPTDLSPVVFTTSFEWTNDWVLRGRPQQPKRKLYKNDVYVTQRGTGKPVARFSDLTVSIPSFGTTLSSSCTTDHPYLYTRAPRHIGTIGSA